MPEFDKSRKIIDVLKNESPKKCPACGADDPEKRMLGGVKNGKDEPFDNHIICTVCGADLTAENNNELEPLGRIECTVIKEFNTTC